MNRSNLTRLALVGCVVLGVAFAAPARAGDPLVYLSWGAPFGQPGARVNLAPSADSTGTDTLYLSFDPGKDAENFVAVQSVINFWPQAGDTLGPFWHFERTAENPMSCRIDFDVTPYDAMSAWSAPGVGMPRYEHTKGGGRFTFIYAVSATSGMKLKAGTVYCLARMYISHKRARLLGFNRPMCIEWGFGEFSVTAKTEADTQGDGNPAVGWNSPDGKACEGFRQRHAPVVTPGATPGLAIPTTAPSDSARRR